MASQVKSMQGGDGDYSYAHNSGTQNFVFTKIGKPHLSQAIHDMCSHGDQPNQANKGVIRFADYGCCYGQNTRDYAEFIITRFIEELLPQGNKQTIGDHVNVTNCGPVSKRNPEFQYFFVDLPSNDFNSLFSTLAVSKLPCSQFYPAGVPGSFYNVVLPKGSVDFAITTYSLHWLSQVPPALLDRNSPAWNGDHVWIARDDHSAGGAVAEAYAQQFQKDVRQFLSSRIHEMASGAVLFVLSLCRAQDKPPATYEPRHDSWSGYFEYTWNELVQEGIIEAHERESFNVPQYNFSRKELEQAIKAMNGDLQIVNMEVIEACENLPESEIDTLLSDPNQFGHYWTSFLRSLIQPMLEAHLGQQRSSVFFERLQSITTSKAHLTTNLVSDILISTLRRK